MSVQARPFFFLPSEFVATNSMQVFAYEDDYAFGVIHSSLQWAWTKAKGGQLKSDVRYTSTVWKTFPWPQSPTELASERRFYQKITDLYATALDYDASAPGSRAFFATVQNKLHSPVQSAAMIDRVVRLVERSDPPSRS